MPRIQNYKIIAILVFLILILPFSFSDKKGGGQSFLVQKGLIVNEAKADCDKICEAKKKRDRAWEKFLNQIQEPGSPVESVSGAGDIPFGGSIIAWFPCPCDGHMVFIIKPVAGPAGPFIVDLKTTALKQFRKLLPGNWVLGTAEVQVTECKTVFLCLPVPVPFTVTTTPGVGTSLTP